MRKPLILLADDNPDVAYTSSLVLEMMGFEVMSAADGAEAIRAARNRTPDYIILDVGLPLLTGFEVAEKMRNELGLRDTIIVAVSGYDKETIRAQDENRCFDYYFTKPVEYDELIMCFHAPLEELELPQVPVEGPQKAPVAGETKSIQ